MRKTILILIFTLAFILRFYQLGSNPPSLDWDEASLGYNAYSLLKTGKDEYGNPWPLSIRSFNDYKPPLYTYLTTLSVALFDLNEFSTRFISALFGVLSVIVGYLLIKELFPNKSSIFYFLFTIFFAVSPWHLQFSRVAFEANVALFFFLAGICWFLKARRNGKFFIFSLISLALSMYTYHSPRLVVPILLLGLTIIYRREVKNNFRLFVLGVIIFSLLLSPLFYQLGTSMAARFSSVTLISPDERLGPSIRAIEFDQERRDFLGKIMHNRRIVYAREILGGYLDHFNFDFLFLTGDAAGRHHPVGMGMLYFWDLPFLLIGFFNLLKNRSQSTYLLLFWFLIASVSASLTKATPHAVRALLYLPTYQMFVALGVVEFMQFIRTHKKKIYANLIFLVTFLFFLFNFFYYLHMYWIHTPIEEARWWQYGYKQVVEEVRSLEDRYKKAIVTHAYDQPYIYFLFYNQIDPFWYQNNWGGGEIQREFRSFGKYEFRRLNWNKDSSLAKVLLVGTPEEIPEEASGLIKEIYFPDGSVAFRIVGR